MKLLITLCYLFSFIFILIMAGLINKFGIIEKQKKGDTIPALIYKLYYYVILVIFYFQFWLLTGVFPLMLLIFIFLANVFSWGIHLFIGSISGFILKDKKEKLSALSAIWTFQNINTVGIGCLLLFIVFGYSIVIKPLIVFWTHETGDISAIISISFYQFTFPAIILSILSILMTWQFMTSEYIDDDYRNSNLVAKFSGIISLTITLLFPIWIFNGNINEVQSNINFSLPPLWVLLAIPMFLFIIGGLFPFFVGIYRYRSQAKSMLNWRKEWLTDMNKILLLPNGINQTTSWNEKMQQLNAEIKDRSEKNELLKYYISLEEQNETHQTQNLQLASDISHDKSNNADNNTIIPEQKSSTNVSAAIDFLKRKMTASSENRNKLNKAAIEAIGKYKDKLIEWDLRFGDLYLLLHLYRNCMVSDITKLKPYLESELNTVNEFSTITTKKNIIAGASLSILSSLIIYLFKTFQDKIFGFIDILVK